MTDVYEKIVSESLRDDLTEIKGIGTTTAEKLYNAKIFTIRQIAEMTPERLSETPGIGLATAAKFIAAAKELIESSQKEGIANETIQIQETLTVESKLVPVEKYEVQEVIVEHVKEFDEEPLIEIEEDFDLSQPEQRKLLGRDDHSRLTTFNPPESGRVKSVIEPVVEDAEEEFDVEPINGYEQTKKINVEIDTQLEIEQITEYYEENSLNAQVERKEKFLQKPVSELQNAIEIDHTQNEPKNIDIKYSRDSTFERIIRKQISDLFGDAGCHEVPDSLKSLKQFTTALDYLGYKITKTSDGHKILFLFPVKRFDQDGTVLIEETKIKLKSHSETDDIGAYIDIEQITRNLLRVRDSMVEDVANEQNFLGFFQRYLRITLSLEGEFGRKSLIFSSGTTQYKVIIEPILLCFIPPRSMEKSLAFPYQRNSNLHAVTRSDIAPLIRFLEKKYSMIVNSDQSFTLKDYAQIEDKFHSSVRYASIPILGYSTTLLVVYFLELYFLLRLFNTIGLAVVGIYLSLLAFFYLKAYKTKKKFKDQFETPYYLQKLKFSETDLLDFREELTDELLTQFGYECLEKDAKFGVIEQSETNALRHNVEIKRAEPEYKNLFESDEVKASVNNIPTFGTKYSSFLEDG